MITHTEIPHIWLCIFSFLFQMYSFLARGCCFKPDTSNFIPRRKQTVESKAIFFHYVLLQFMTYLVSNVNKEWRFFTNRLYVISGIALNYISRNYLNLPRNATNTATFVPVPTNCKMHVLPTLLHAAVPQPVNKISAFYKTRSFIATLTSACQLPLS